MKEIKASIKAHLLEAVSQALHRVPGLAGMSVNGVRGRGRSWEGRHKSLAEPVSECVRHVKIENVRLDVLAETILEAIEPNARTGLRGDGKIYGSNMENAVRVGTSEKGVQAV